MVRLSDGNPFVRIAGVIGGIAVAITAIIGYFMSENAWILAPIIGTLAVMGILLGYFASTRY